MCTHEANQNLQEIKELVLGQTFDDEIAVLGGFIRKTEEENGDQNEIEIIDEQEELIIGKHA